jgi:tRNA uridine 5-carboxymethylaminomethyl modification enzyme
MSDVVVEQVVYDVKYSGYIARQQLEIDRQQRLQDKKIPDDFDYDGIGHLRTEARQKLAKIRPVSIAQASRISGITPADMALVLAHLRS